MLVRKENELEIWTDRMPQGTAKKCFLVAIISAILFIFIFLNMGYDYSVKEIYIFLGLLLSPCFIIAICGIVFLYREKNEHLVMKVCIDNIEVYKKKNIKMIPINKIYKVNAVSSRYGSFIVLFYKENDIEKKYSFPISAANRNLVVIALKEYKKDIVVNE